MARSPLALRTTGVLSLAALVTFGCLPEEEGAEAPIEPSAQVASATADAVRITATNEGPESLHNYTVPIAFDTRRLVVERRLRADCADLSAYDADRRTPLPYWVSVRECNGPTTRVFVKVPAIAAGGTAQFYLVYGTSVDEAKWTHFGDGVYRVANGLLMTQQANLFVAKENTVMPGRRAVGLRTNAASGLHDDFELGARDGHGRAAPRLALGPGTNGILCVDRELESDGVVRLRRWPLLRGAGGLAVCRLRRPMERRRIPLRRRGWVRHRDDQPARWLHRLGAPERRSEVHRAGGGARSPRARSRVGNGRRSDHVRGLGLRSRCRGPRAGGDARVGDVRSNESVRHRPVCLLAPHPSELTRGPWGPLAPPRQAIR